MARISDYRRVVGSAQLLYIAGRSLKRQAVRYTALALIIGTSVIVINTIGEQIRDYWQPTVSNISALKFPLLVAILTFGLGNTLTGISNLFSSEKIMVADANAMNLMEDRKKADRPWHLEVLWERVFKYEATLHHHHNNDDPTGNRISRQREELLKRVRSWPKDCREHFGVTDDNEKEFVRYVARFQPIASRIPASKEEFITSATYALQNSFPQKVEHALIGCDLSLLEDWYDGAFFTAGDDKLKEQFAAHSAIRGIRKIVGIGAAARVKETLSGHPSPLWFALTMKKIGMSTGTLIDRMNRKYIKSHEPSFFDAQDFLWPHEDTEQAIRSRFDNQADQIIRHLKSERKKMIRNIFSANITDAHCQITRMFARDFRNALALRLDYDIEFAAELLDESPLADLEQLSQILSRPIYPCEKAKKRVCQAKKCLRILGSFLEEHFENLSDKPLELRAARIGFWVNRFGVRKLLLQNPQKAAEIFESRIIKSEKRYSHRICQLRQHYELTRLQLLSYVRIVDELGQYQ